MLTFSLHAAMVKSTARFPKYSSIAWQCSSVVCSGEFSQRRMAAEQISFEGKKNVKCNTVCFEDVSVKIPTRLNLIHLINQSPSIHVD